MINKGVCDKGFIWNPSSSECEWDKSCDIGKYLDYSNFKCRKKLIDKAIEYCTKTIKETRLFGKTLDENKHKCISCVVYKVLFWIFFIFFVIYFGIGIYSSYYKYMNRNKENVPRTDYTCQTTIYWTYKWQKSKNVTLKTERIIIILTIWLI